MRPKGWREHPAYQMGRDDYEAGVERCMRPDIRADTAPGGAHDHWAYGYDDRKREDRELEQQTEAA
jgi:hypothetical protein